MKRLTRMLSVTAALFGIGAFLFALRVASDSHGQDQGGMHPAGIAGLIVGLSAASLATWRGQHGAWTPLTRDHA